MATTTINETHKTKSRLMSFSGLVAPFLFISAALLLLVSIGLPYWSMHLDAPQYDYRGGLDIVIYVDSLTGKDPNFDELRELNNLNHYIGMRHLDDAAVFERSIAIPSIIIFAVLLVLAAYARVRKTRWQKWAWLLTLPPLTFSIIFVGDLYYWLRDSGQNLDSTAAFSSSIKPFTPTLLGKGMVGQFATDARLDVGWFLAVLASLLILTALLMGAVDYWRARRAN